MRRPAIFYEDLAEIDDETRPELTENEKTEVEVMLKYDGYIQKQINEVEKMVSLEKPMTVGQASRISGVSPADINVLLVYLEKEMRSK